MAHRALKVSSLKSASVSSEVASLIPPLKSPSSIMAATLRARTISGSGFFLACLLRLAAGAMLVVNASSSCSCCFTRLDKDIACLLLLGCLRHIGANKKSLFQVSTVLLLTKSSKIVVSLEQHCCLADLGMRLRTLPFGIVVSDVVAGKDGCDGANDGEDGEAPGCGRVDVPDGGLGGLPEPGHRADSGPWVLIKPEVVVERDLKQTAHTPAAINYNYICKCILLCKNIFIK